MNGSQRNGLGEWPVNEWRDAPLKRPRKKIVMLAMAHQYQLPGDPGNALLEACLAYLAGKFKVQAVLEQWSEEKGSSFAEGLAKKLGVDYVNVGTPDEGPFRTCWPQISDPAHDGTLPYDPNAPSMLHEYGPLDAQNAREELMVRSIRMRMEDYRDAIFIVGIAHTHSLHSKLVSMGFDVTSYIVA
jgi:hypothetical protein